MASFMDEVANDSLLEARRRDIFCFIHEPAEQKSTVECSSARRRRLTLVHRLLFLSGRENETAGKGKGKRKGDRKKKETKILLARAQQSRRSTSCRKNAESPRFEADGSLLRTRDSAKSEEVKEGPATSIVRSVVFPLWARLVLLS